MIKQNYKLHIVALSFIYTLGNAIILTPATDLVNLILCCALSLSLVLLISVLLKWGQKNKAVHLITALPLCAVIIYGVVTTFSDYIKYLKTEQMPRSNKLFLAIVLVVIVVFFAVSKKQAIYKYCLFVSVIIAAIILICFVGGIKFFDYKNFKANLFNGSFLPKQAFKFFLPVIVLPIFNNNESKEIKVTICGVLAGFIFLYLTALQSVLTFGGGYIPEIPYLKAIGVISSGSLFTRLDGAIWFVFFVSAIIKITVCVKALLITIKQLK